MLTYSEVAKIVKLPESGITRSYSEDANSYIINGNYWLGSAHDPTDVWALYGDVSYLSYFDYYGAWGVRPVIEIPRSLISVNNPNTEEESNNIQTR